MYSDCSFVTKAINVENAGADVAIIGEFQINHVPYQPRIFKYIFLFVCPQIWYEYDIIKIYKIWDPQGMIKS